MTRSLPSRRPGSARWLLAVVLAVAVATLSALAPARSTAAPSSDRAERSDRSARPGRTTDADLRWLQGERVLFIGDSLMQSVGPHLRDRLDRLDVTNRVLAYAGSGLGFHPYRWSWAQLAAREVQRFDPTVVVVQMCCNWAPPGPPDEQGRPIRPGTPQFRRAWEERARELAGVLTSTGADLWWVVTPPGPLDAFTAEVIDPINDTTFAQAHHPAGGVGAPRLIRWDLALTAGTGTFRAAVPVDGAPARVRDELHFSPAGRRLAAEATLAALAGRAQPTPWGPFDSLGTVPRLVVERAYGLDPYGAEAGMLASRFRTVVGGGTPWRDALTAMLLDQRWGATAAPMVRLSLQVRGHVPTVDELRRWTGTHPGSTTGGRAAGRATLAAVAHELLGDPAVADRVAVSSTRATFIAAAHLLTLGRAPTAQERMVAEAALHDGETPEGLIAALSARSPRRGPREALVRATVVEVALLGRTPSPLGALVGDLGSDGGEVPSWRSLVDAVLASPEGRRAIASYVPTSP